MIYRTSQDQMNEVMTFGMSLMFMGFMLGLVRSLSQAQQEQKNDRSSSAYAKENIRPASGETAPGAH